MSKEQELGYEKDDVVKHYKTKDVYVIVEDCVRHSETEEGLIIYQEYVHMGNGLFHEGDMWARPETMFEEEVDGVPRFELVGSLNKIRDEEIKEWEDDE